jgi:hypothetical protein
MATTKLIPGIGLALLVAVGVGWVWGASGRSDIDGALQIAELRGQLLEGRAAVLDARLDIYRVNFGEASRNVEVARAALHAANARLMSQRRTGRGQIAGGRVHSDRRGAASRRRAQSGCERCGRRPGEDPRRCARAHGETLTRAAIGAYREIHYVWQKDGAQ